MKSRQLSLAAAALAVALFQTPAAAQVSQGHGGGHGGTDQPHLHINPRWKECSFQLDASLTQAAWRQFTQEAGLVVYFRPLVDAQPMGKGRFEVSVLQWETGIDDAEDAWNDTFVHPDSSHWLFEGDGLAFPGLTARVGVTDNMDVGVYVTKAPGANYGFYGAQVQRSLFGGKTGAFATAARLSFVSMYGPEDVDFTVYGADLLASRTIAIGRWPTISPYAGVSTYLATSHEKSGVVDLDDERVLSAQGMVGASVQLAGARVAMEYSVARVNTMSLKVGFGR